MILGYVLAVLAAVASGSGSILAAIGVKRAGAFGGRSADLVGLVRQYPYFLGIAVDIVGFGFAAAALNELPLFLVQSVLAFSVGVTATISALMGTRLPGRGWVSLGIGAIGLVLLGISASPGPAVPLVTGWRWVLVGMPLVIALIAYRARRLRHWAVPVLAFAAGIGYSMVGVSARTLAMPAEVWQLVLEPAAWAIVFNGLMAAVAFAMALQKGGATAATAVMFTTNTALSSVIGVLYLDDQVREGYWAAAAAGFVLAVAGAIAVAHYSAIAGNRPKAHADHERVTAV